MNSFSQNIWDIIIYLIVFAFIGFFIWRKPNYRKDIFLILNNLKTVYLNFVHWNISKVIIRLYSFVTWLIISSPFLALAIYLIFKLSKVFNKESLSLFISTGDIDSNLLLAFLGNIWSVIFLIFILVLIVSFFAFTFMYGDFLIQNIYKWYLEKTKIPYSKNLYFSWKHISKYLWVLVWNSLYLAIPMLILFAGILVLVILYKYKIITNDPSNPNMILWGISLLYFIWVSVYFVYLFIRLSFSYIGLIYTDNIVLPAKFYVEKSFTLTKWNIFKIISLWIPFLALYSFISLIVDILWLSNNIFVYILLFLTISSISYMVLISIYAILEGKKVKKI
ncbi:MAG: hypothetical protein ACD_49C00060G0045 [uncultured bacterium (gcode 4)]|uniref:Glycerophosphoryl diester phosphodiesterase membrane domain-containing protein n=1 Tax=uncultured bacterium (gcode 4) TaxID=1234023 RepID=K2BBR8_9BACT|nr:MAG: hypothetical protein ACD_49C00060G0045 [uncultured bacterium (gcode 4)]